jgi:hypothetical protein
MRGILAAVLVSAGAILGGCASDVSVSTHEPAADRILSLAADVRAAVIGDAAGKDEGDIPECVRRELQEALPALQLVMANDFRRMAGPRFSSTPKTANEVTAALLDPSVQAEARRAALRYLVVVGGHTDSEDFSELGGRLRGTRKRTRVEARVWDIPAAEYVGEFAVEAWGTTETAYGLLWLFAATEGVACERVVQMLAKRFS